MLVFNDADNPSNVINLCHPFPLFTTPMGARHPIVNTPNTQAPGHEVERDDFSRGKHTRLLAGWREEQTCKQTFMNNFTQKSKLLPGAACKLLEGGVRRNKILRTK